MKAIQMREVQGPPHPLLEQQITLLPYLVAALGNLLGLAVERTADVIGVLRSMARNLCWPRQPGRAQLTPI